MVMCDCLHEYLVHVRVWGEGRRVVWGNHFGYIVLVYIYSMLWSVTFLKKKIVFIKISKNLIAKRSMKHKLNMDVCTITLKYLLLNKKNL